LHTLNATGAAERIELRNDELCDTNQEKKNEQNLNDVPMDFAEEIGLAAAHGDSPP
jgi:hypothetical protein